MTNYDEDKAAAAANALLDSIAKSAASTTSSGYLRSLAEAYALVRGTVSSVEHNHVDVKT